MVRWLLTTTCIATALSGSEAMAAEQAFYNGPQWQVALVDTYATTGEAPYCAIRTTTWSSKQVSIEMPLQGVDQTGVAIRVRKDGWQLPIGETTEFGFVVGPLGTPFTAKAVDEDTLYTAFDPKAPTEGWLLFDRAIGAVFSNRKPLALMVAFRGSEQPWHVPSVDKFQAHQITSASRECQAALNHLGPSIYGAVPEADNTSPFGKPEQVPVPEDKDDQYSLKEPMEKDGDSSNSDDGYREPESTDGKWEFILAEEDWGPTCVVQTKTDNLRIGFMAAPGKGVIAFIEGLELQSGKAQWRVDMNKVHTADGEVSEYFGFLSFELPSTVLVEELTHGSVLSISVTGGPVLTLTTYPARDAFGQFVQCYSQNGPAASEGVE